MGCETSRANKLEISLLAEVVICVIPATLLAGKGGFAPDVNKPRRQATVVSTTVASQERTSFGFPTPTTAKPLTIMTRTVAQNRFSPRRSACRRASTPPRLPRPPPRSRGRSTARQLTSSTAGFGRHARSRGWPLSRCSKLEHNAKAYGALKSWRSSGRNEAASICRKRLRSQPAPVAPNAALSPSSPAKIWSSCSHSIFRTLTGKTWKLCGMASPRTFFIEGIACGMTRVDTWPWSTTPRGTDPI